MGAAWAFVDPPTATTGAATSVGETGATLNGTLGAGGSSTAYFEYGTTAAYGASTATQSVGVSGSPSPLAAAIGGLAPGTTYHFRLVAENSGGVAYGDDQTFTTEAGGRTPARRPNPTLRHRRHRADSGPSCGAARTPVHDEMARGQPARPHQPREAAHRNDLLVLTQRAGNGGLQLHPAGRGSHDDGGYAHLHGAQWRQPGRVPGAHLARTEAEAGALHARHHRHRLCRSALCAEVAELFDRAVVASRLQLPWSRPALPASNSASEISPVPSGPRWNSRSAELDEGALDSLGQDLDVRCRRAIGVQAEDHLVGVADDGDADRVAGEEGHEGEDLDQWRAERVQPLLGGRERW